MLSIIEEEARAKLSTGENMQQRMKNWSEARYVVPKTVIENYKQKSKT